MNTPNDIKPNNDVLRQAMQRRKARRPIHELPEGFEDRVMERIKDIQIPVKDDSSSKKKGTVIRLWSLRTVGVAASIAGLLFVYNRMTISDGVVDNNNMMAKTEVVKHQSQGTIKAEVQPTRQDVAMETIATRQVSRAVVSRQDEVEESIQPEQVEETTIEATNMEETIFPDVMLSINDAEQVMDDFMKQYEGIASVSASPVTEQEHNANEVSYHVMHEIAQNMNEFTKQHNNLSNGGTTYGY
jgi:hypothetical protein